MLLVILAIFSLLGLMVLHEFGHFILAKKFGVKVEEFGIGYPPRIFGKKIGETIYSLNLIPFGAFVKIYGEEENIENSRSFSQKPIWQRSLIVLAGVLSFWIISAVILSVVMAIGAPTAVSDEASGGLKDVKVQIVGIASKSPAELAGIKAGDAIASLKLKVKSEKLKIDKVKQIQEFAEKHKGEEIVLTIERGKDVFDVTLIPRISPPEGEGSMGVALSRIAIKTYPWYQAPIEGISATLNLTYAIIEGYVNVIKHISNGLPSGVQLMGPVGIFSLFNQMGQLGLNYYLQFLAIISIYLAVFNLLPIPAVDGGKLLFLAIEKINGRPVNPQIEQKITATFFALLLILMVFVTIKDIGRLF